MDCLGLDGSHHVAKVRVAGSNPVVRSKCRVTGTFLGHAWHLWEGQEPHPSRSHPDRSRSFRCPLPSARAESADVVNYLATLRRLSARVDLAEATALDLRAYLGDRAETVSAATIAVDVRALRCFYRWRSEMLDVPDPSSTLKLPKIPEPATESVSLETFTKVLASIPTAGRWNARDRAILFVLWGSGARLSEVARMTVADLELHRGHVHHRHRQDTASPDGGSDTRDHPSIEGLPPPPAPWLAFVGRLTGPVRCRGHQADDPAPLEGCGSARDCPPISPRAGRALARCWWLGDVVEISRRMGLSPDGAALCTSQRRAAGHRGAPPTHVLTAAEGTHEAGSGVRSQVPGLLPQQRVLAGRAHDVPAT